MRKKIALALLIVGCLAVASIPAHAAKGGSGKGKGGVTPYVGGGLVLNQSDPHYGDSVSFSSSYPSVRETVSIWVHCSQNGEMVYQFSGPDDGQFPLGGAGTSSAWTGGAATCGADLYYYTTQGQTQTSLVTLGTTSFEVAA